MSRPATMLPAAAAVLALALSAAPAVAIQITALYDPGGFEAVDPCTQDVNNNFIYKACAGGVDRTPGLQVLMNWAAAYWGDVLEGNEQVLIKYWWHLDNSPDGNVEDIDGNGRPSEGRIRIPVDFNWYYDPTPNDHSEFEMGPRLYRDTHLVEQAEAFSGTPPEVFEVSFKGKEINGLSSDLLTAVLHEMAHTLGLDKDVTSVGRNPECDAPPNHYFEVDPFSVGGNIMAIKAWEDPGDPTNFDCAHLALGGIQACNNNVWCESHQALMWPGAFPDHRTLPGAADILAVAEAANWPYDLPRKYSLFTDNWGLSFTWLGNGIPDANDGVFIMNTPLTTITVLAPRVARNVTITDGNRLNVFSILDVGETISLSGAGTVLTADLGSHVQAIDLNIDPDALLDVPFAGLVDSFRINSAGEIRGAGLVDAVTVTNTGKIRANGGPFLFTSSGFDPPFDLDGAGLNSVQGVEIQAVTGDLTFDGELLDPLRSEIRVAASRTLTFTQGWTHEAAFNGHLNLEGTASEARIAGTTTLKGIVNADGLSRFTHAVTFDGLNARLRVTLGGTTPGTGHTQVNIDGVATLDGVLDVQLELGYLPNPGDEFVILTSPNVAGQFAQHQGLDIGINQLSFDVIYLPDQVKLVATAPAGAIPGSLGVPGEPMTVEPAIGNGIRLSWSLPCTGEVDFEVYEGTLGDFSSHAPIMCTTSGLSSVVVNPPAAGPSTYYLVVPHNPFRQGSYGVDSNGAARPPGIGACLPQKIMSCPPV